MQDLNLYRGIADELGALLVVDAVASLAGVALDVDRQRIDICFSGTQKALSAPQAWHLLPWGPARGGNHTQTQDPGMQLVFLTWRQ